MHNFEGGQLSITAPLFLGTRGKLHLWQCLDCQGDNWLTAKISISAMQKIGLFAACTFAHLHDDGGRSKSIGCLYHQASSVVNVLMLI